MALTKHEVLAVAGTAVSPATTLAALEAFGCAWALVRTDQSVRFTTDGVTTPVVTGGSEVGILLTSSESVTLHKEEFLASKWLDVSADARVQFAFLTETRGK